MVASMEYEGPRRSLEDIAKISLSVVEVYRYDMGRIELDAL